jgi:predicted aspartyl protease
MPAYDAARYEPPAPVAAVSLRHSDDETRAGTVWVLIDTGADVTLLPRHEVEQLGVQPIESTLYELVGFDGSRSLASACRLDLVFLDRVFRGRYLLIEGEQGILGRDVLNHVALLLDGPNLQWAERRS